MEITVNYKGILTENTGKISESLTSSGSLDQIMKQLKQKHPSLEKLNFVVAVNSKISHMDEKIKPGDILTLIPPAPGG